MVKGGKKEPSTRSLYRLKGIKNAVSSQNLWKEGRWMGKERREHASIDLKKNTSRAKSRQ